jgi:hypothetical protein
VDVECYNSINVFDLIAQCYNFAILVLEKNCYYHGHENNQDTRDFEGHEQNMMKKQT